MHYNIFKRTVDVILSLVLLIITFPLLLFFCLIILIETRRSPIIVQERGITLRTGRLRIYKLRTLINSEALDRTENTINNIFTKPVLSEFVIPLGAYMRRSGIDELPQLINVMKGEMSLIGPRPLTIKDIQILKDSYPGYYEKREEIDAKPGISGLWQIYGQREKGISELINLDTFYTSKKSITFDLKLIFKTALIMVTAANSDSISEREKKKSIFQDKIYNTEY